MDSTNMIPSIDLQSWYLNAAIVKRQNKSKRNGGSFLYNTKLRNALNE